MNKLLKKLRVDKISFCISGGPPATGFDFIISKSEPVDMEEIIKEAEIFWGEDFQLNDVEKENKKEELVLALKEANKYREDLPDFLKSSFDKIIGWALKGYNKEPAKYPYPEKKPEEGEIKKSLPWDTLDLSGGRKIIIQKEETEDEDKDFDDPMMRELIKIRKKLSAMEGSDKPDPWGSFEIIPGFGVVPVVAKDEEAHIEDTPIKKTKGIKKGIESSGLENYEVDEDRWPSL